MRAAVDLENVVVEILDAEAQPGDANLADGAELLLGQRSGLAFEGRLPPPRPTAAMPSSIVSDFELIRPRGIEGVPPPK